MAVCQAGIALPAYAEASAPEEEPASYRAVMPLRVHIDPVAKELHPEELPATLYLLDADGQTMTTVAQPMEIKTLDPVLSILTGWAQTRAVWTNTMMGSPISGRCRPKVSAVKFTMYAA